jgi:hypothetical protein
LASASQHKHWKAIKYTPPIRHPPDTHLFTVIPPPECRRRAASRRASSSSRRRDTHLCAVQRCRLELSSEVASVANRESATPGRSFLSEHYCLRSRLPLHVCSAASSQDASREQYQLWAGHRGEHHNKAQTMRPNMAYSCGGRSTSKTAST